MMKGRLVRWVLATLILLIAVVWVSEKVGWGAIFAAWRGISPLTLTLLTLVTFASYLLRAYRVYLQFGYAAGHSFRHYLRISLLHNALNNLLPMRLGEAAFPLLMKQTFNASLIDTSSGLLLIRLMDLHWLLVLLSVVLALQTEAFMLLLTLLLLALPPLARRLLGGLRQRLPSHWRQRAERLARGMQVTAGQGLQLYALTALIWISKLAALTLVMLYFIPLPGAQALLAVVAADLSSVLPIHGLAGSGTYEVAMLAALAPFGLSTEAVLLAAVNVHLYLLLVSVLSGALAWLIPVADANRLESRDNG